MEKPSIHMQEASELTEHIRELIEQGRLLPPRQADINHAHISRLRDKASALFAEANGWKYSGTGKFGWRTLARGRVHIYFSDTEMPPECDHPYCFRLPNKRAAAIVGHVYGIERASPQWLEAMKESASTLGLSVEVSDWPSWWYPGATTTVVWTALPAFRDAP